MRFTFLIVYFTLEEHFLLYKKKKKSKKRNLSILIFHGFDQLSDAQTRGKCFQTLFRSIAILKCFSCLGSCVRSGSELKKKKRTVLI